MGIRLVIPKSVKHSLYFKSRRWAIGLYAHNLQSDRRWLFLIRIGRRRFGYLTTGDSEPGYMSYSDAGWYWPWQKKTLAGRG